MISGKEKLAKRKWMSPWMIIGSVCILAIILMVLAVKNVHREREFMTQALLSQANVLMRSIEAGSRTGMMEMGWGHRQHQLLLEEMAQQADVLYVALVNPMGQVVAHSDRSQVGQILPFTFPESGETAHRFVEKEARSFEVIRLYQPWMRQKGRGFGRGDLCPMPMSFQPPPTGDLFIVVGLDPTPFEHAIDQDIRQTMVLLSTMLLVGAGGFVSLIWAQNYHSARSSLQTMQAFTSTLVAQMPVGMIATDPQGQIQQSNESARMILKRPDGLRGHIEDIPCLLPILTQLQRNERLAGRELLCLLPGGESVPLLVNAAGIRDGENGIVGCVLLFTDVTEIRQLEERLRRSERLASIGRLAAGIAHEIRNPLSSIKGFAGILANRAKTDDRSRQIAQVMEGEVERLDRVVSELLDYARPTELHKRSSSCEELIKRSLQLIDKDAQQRGVAVTFRVKPHELSFDVDPDRFTQVLLNLYLNALQAMDEGGSLVVEALGDGDSVMLSVSDSGAGISPEHLPHVFDPYFTTKPQGVGLGLANVYKYVEAHGGEIKIDSEAGRGTEIIMRIPKGHREGNVPTPPENQSSRAARVLPT
ncbi:ATP-binding protein [Desulforhabdus sp. TSK]|uniref:ATP-binding protein n=1 Tax=Desulforhabdus sp. TSK TaxID=2925014 RepID=UPI001FC7D3C0|nr:ATP-binding protein [Desulforhabdus sp. TSK]GKT09756.1 hypothetical protein DSTSK_30610 [Desulforhabdus sp. TSK]